MPPTTKNRTVTARKYVRIRERNQITLPAEFIAGLAIHPGDFLEIGRTNDGSIYLKPTVLVTAGSPQAEREEALAEKEIAGGAYDTFDSSEEFIKNLKGLTSKPASKAAEQKKQVTPVSATTTKTG